jgi:hypothetical protein
VENVSEEFPGHLMILKNLWETLINEDFKGFKEMIYKT